VDHSNADQPQVGLKLTLQLDSNIERWARALLSRSPQYQRDTAEQVPRHDEGI